MWCFDDFISELNSKPRRRRLPQASSGRVQRTPSSRTHTGTCIRAPKPRDPELELELTRSAPATSSRNLALLASSAARLEAAGRELPELTRCCSPLSNARSHRTLWPKSSGRSNSTAYVTRTLNSNGSLARFKFSKLYLACSHFPIPLGVELEAASRESRLREIREKRMKLQAWRRSRSQRVEFGTSL